MNDWPMILLGWGVTAAAVAGYAARVLRRGRVLARQVPDADKPWT